jgi:hypothetical protein
MLQMVSEHGSDTMALWAQNEHKFVLMNILEYAIIEDCLKNKILT